MKARMFSIIIPTWNNLPYLQLAVRSIRAHSAREHQIIVHVNDGSDGTLDWVRAEGLAHTASPENVGVCYAVNAATRLVTQDHVLYLNDDMYVLPGWDASLARHAAGFRARGIGSFMLSGTMIQPPDRPASASSSAPYVSGATVFADYGRRPETFERERLLADQARLVRGYWRGSIWPPTLVTTDDWLRVGAYSVELSPGMSSDNDFAMKLWHSGCRAFVGIGDALVYHFGCVSTGRIRKNDGRRQFLRKWGITQRDFDDVVLRRGQDLPASEVYAPIDAAALEPALRRARWRGAIKSRF